MKKIADTKLRLVSLRVVTCFRFSALASLAGGSSCSQPSDFSTFDWCGQLAAPEPCTGPHCVAVYCWSGVQHGASLSELPSPPAEYVGEPCPAVVHTTIERLHAVTQRAAVSGNFENCVQSGWTGVRRSRLGLPPAGREPGWWSMYGADGHLAPNDACYERDVLANPLDRHFVVTQACLPKSAYYLALEL